MNQWQPGQAEAMFSQPASSHLNPSALYNPNNSSANPSHFDLSAASSPFQPGLQNGGLNPQTPSAAFNNQTFQPGLLTYELDIQEATFHKSSTAPEPEAC